MNKYITKLNECPKDIPLIVHLPGGRWQIQFNGINSTPAKYEERIIDSFGRMMLCGQTEYFGKEQIWEIKNVVSNCTIDLSA